MPIFIIMSQTQLYDLEASPAGDQNEFCAGRRFRNDYKQPYQVPSKTNYELDYGGYQDDELDALRECSVDHFLTLCEDKFTVYHAQSGKEEQSQVDEPDDDWLHPGVLRSRRQTPIVKQMEDYISECVYGNPNYHEATSHLPYPITISCRRNGRLTHEKWFSPFEYVSWEPTPMKPELEQIDTNDLFIYHESSFTAQSGVETERTDLNEEEEFYKRVSLFLPGHSQAAAAWILVNRKRKQPESLRETYNPLISKLRPKHFKGQAGEEFFNMITANHDNINNSDLSDPMKLAVQISEVVEVIKGMLQKSLLTEGLIKKIIDGCHIILVTIHNVIHTAQTFKQKLWIIYQSLVASGIVQFSKLINFGLEALALLINFILWTGAKGMEFVNSINPFVAQAGESFSENQISDILQNGFYAICGYTEEMIAQGGNEKVSEHEHVKVPLNLHYWSKCVSSVTNIGKGLEFFSKYLWMAVSTVYQKIFNEPLVTDSTKIVLDKVVLWMKTTREAFVKPNADPSVLVNDTRLCTKILSLKAQGEELAIQLTEAGYGKHNFTAFFALQREMTEFADQATTVLTTAKPRTPPTVIYLYGKSNVGKSFMQTTLTRDVFEAEAIEKGEKLDKSLNLMYTRYAIDVYFSGYVNQECIVIDDLGQVDDPEVTTRNVEEIIHMANVAPFLLNMAALGDKGKRFLTSRLLIASSNIPQLLPRNHMKVAEPKAFYRRIDVQVQVEIKPEYIEKDASGFERIKTPDGKFTRECYKLTRMDPFTGKPFENAQPMDYYDLLALVYADFKKKNQQKENVTTWLENNPVDMERLKSKMHAQAGEDEEVQLNKKWLEDIIIKFAGKVPTREDIYKFLVQKKKVHTRKHGWLSIYHVGEHGCILKTEEGHERILKYEQIIHPGAYDTPEKLAIYMHNYLTECHCESDISAPNTTNQQIMEGLPEAVKKTPIPVSQLAELLNVSEEQAKTMQAKSEEIKKLVEPSIQHAETLYEKGKKFLEEAKEKNTILKAILVFAAALGALGGAYALYKFFSTSSMEGQGERGNQGSASRGMDPKIKHMFARGTEIGKAQKLNRINWKGQSGVALDPILSLIEKNSIYVRIANGAGEHYHCGGLAICDRIVLMPKHILLYFNSLDTDNKITIETLRKEGESFTYDMKELDIFEEESADLMFVVLPKQVDPFPNIIKHFIKADDLKNANISSSVMCVRLKNTINRCYSYNTTRGGNIKYSFEYGGEKIESVCPSTLMYPGHNEGGYCGNPIIIDNDKLVGRVAGVHLFGDGKRGGASTLTLEYITKMVEEITTADFGAQAGWEEHVNDQGVPMLKYSDKIKFVGSIDPKKAHRMAHNTKIIQSALYNRWHPAKTAPAMLAPHPPIYPLQNAIDKVGEKHVRVQPDMDLVEAIAAQERLKISYFVPARLLTDEECIHGVPSWKYTKGLYMGTSGGFDPNRGEKGYVPSKGKSRYFDRERRGNDWHYTMTKAMSSQLNEAESFYRAGATGIMLSELNLKDERRPLAKALAGKTRPFVSAQLFHLLLGRKYFGAYLECLALSRTKTGIAKGTNPHSQDWGEMFRRHEQVSAHPKELEGDASNFDWTSGGPIQEQWVKEVNMWYRVFAEQEFYDTYGSFDEGNKNLWEALQRRLKEEETVRIGLVSDATKTIMILVANDVIFVNEGMISGYFATFEHNSGNSKIIHQYCPLKRARDIRRLLQDKLFDNAYALFSVGGNTMEEFKKAIKDTDTFNYKVSDLKKLFELEVGGDDFWLTLHEIIGWYNFYMHIEETKKLGWTFTSSDKSGDMYKHRDLKDVSFLKRTFRVEHGRVFAPMPLLDVIEIMYWVSSDMEMGEALHENARSVFLELGHHGREIFTEWTNKINAALLIAGYDAVPMTYDEWLDSYNNGDFQDEKPITSLDYVYTAQSGKDEDSDIVKELNKFIDTIANNAPAIQPGTSLDTTLAMSINMIKVMAEAIRDDDTKDEVLKDIEKRMVQVIKGLNQASTTYFAQGGCISYVAQVGYSGKINEYIGMATNLNDQVQGMDVPNSVKERFGQMFVDLVMYVKNSGASLSEKLDNVITDVDYMQKALDDMTNTKFEAQSGRAWTPKETINVPDMYAECTETINEFKKITGSDIEMKFTNPNKTGFVGTTTWMGINLVSHEWKLKIQCKAELCTQILRDYQKMQRLKTDEKNHISINIQGEELAKHLASIVNLLDSFNERLSAIEENIAPHFRAQSGKEEIVSETTGGHTDTQGLTTTVDIFEEDVDRVPTSVQPYFMGNDPYNTPSLGSVMEREYRIGILTWDGSQAQNTLITGSNLNFPYALLNIAPNLVEKKNRFHYWRARKTIIRLEITGSQFHSGILVGGWLPHTNTANAMTFRKDNFWQTIQCGGFFLSPNAQKNVRIEIPYTSSRLYTTDELTATNVGFFGSMWIRVLFPLALANQTGTPAVTISIFAHMEGIDLAAPSLTAQAGGPQKEAIDKSKQGVISGTLEALSGMAMSIAKIPLGSFSGGAAALGAGLKALSLGAKAMGYNKPNSVAATQPMYLSTVNSTCDGSGLNTTNDLSVEPGGLIGNGPNFFGRAEDEMLIMHIASKPGMFDVFSFNSTAVAGEVIRKWGVSPALKPVYLISTPPSIYRMFHTPLSSMAFLFKEWSGSLKFHIMISCNNAIQGRIRFSWHPTRTEIPTDFTTGEGDFLSKVINFQGDTVTSFIIPWLKPTPCDYVPIGYGVGDAGNNGALAMSIVNPVTTSDTVGSSTVNIAMLIAAGPDFQLYRPGEQTSYEEDSWTYEHKFLTTGSIAGDFQAQSGSDSSVFTDIFSQDFPPLNPAMGTIKQRMVTQESVANLKTLLHRYELKRNGDISTGIISYASMTVNAIDPYDNGANGQLYPSTFDWVNWCFLYSRGGFNYMLLNANDVALNMEQTGIMFIQNGTKADQPGSIGVDTQHTLITEKSWGRDGWVVEDLSYKKAIQFSLPYWGRNNFVVSPTACFSTTWSNYDRNNFVAITQYIGRHNSDQQNFFCFQSVKDDFHAGWFCGGPVMYYKVNAIAESKRKAATSLSPLNNTKRS